MPNEVYKAAVKGLGALVAPRAARRLVDEALRATNRTADDVTQTAMRRLLETRVKREMKGLFPEHVLRQSLARVAADLEGAGAAPARRGLFGRRGASAGGSRTERGSPRRAGPDDPDAVGSGPAAAGTDPVDPFDSDELEVPVYGHESSDLEQQREVRKSSVYLPAVDLPGLTDPAGTIGVESNTAAVRQTAPGRQQPGGLHVPAEMVEHVIRTFADLETVRQIVVIDKMTVTQVRGEGLETEKLAALTVATKGLLARAGDLRLFSLEFDEGVLFLFPTREGAIVVLTQPKVNIGAVLAARAVLEEAA